MNTTMRRLLSICILCLLSLALCAQQKYKLTLKTQPLGVAGFYTIAPSIAFGERERTSYYIPAGEYVSVSIEDTYSMFDYWKLKEWKVIEGNIELPPDEHYASRVSFRMPAENVTLMPVLEYDPENPVNPMPNGWYPDEGLLVMDNIEGKNFRSLIEPLIPDKADYPLVRDFMMSGTPTNIVDVLRYNLTAEDFPNLTRVDVSRMSEIEVLEDLQGRPWTELLLPSTVKAIRSDAFLDTHLENLVLYATTPPRVPTYRNYYTGELMDNPFPSSLDMTVYVPAESLPLYEADEGWNIFNLQPIAEDAASVTVNVLPDATLEQLAPYYGMTLELLNVKTLTSRKMLITNRHSYLFASQPKGTTYQVRVLSPSGSIIGHVDNIYLQDQYVSVDLTDLHPLCSLDLQVKQGSSTVSADKYSHLWVDKEGKVIQRGGVLSGVLSDEPLQVVVTLTDEALKAAYRSCDTLTINRPADYAQPQHVSYTLQPVPVHQLSATVVRADGAYMGKQTARMSLYRITNEGNKLVTESVFNNPSAPDANYPYQGLVSDPISSLPEGVYEMAIRVEGSNLSSGSQRFTLNKDTQLTFSLEETNGSSIRMTWKHYGVVALGASQGMLSSKRVNEGIFTIRNVYDDIIYKDFSISDDNAIRLKEQLKPGTEIEVTLGNSDNSQYAPVTNTGLTDADGNLKLDFVTYDYGAIEASFAQTEASSISVRVFDVNGNLVRNKVLSEDHTVTFTQIKDGIYTVVMMEHVNGITNAMNSKADVDKYLKKGVDYVEKTVQVKSGQTVAANEQIVPTMTFNSLYTDRSKTSFTPKSSKLTVGEYQTLSMRVAFQSEYLGKISQLKAVVTLPEDNDCFVEGSVLVDNSKSSYTRKGNQIEIPILENKVMRFCMVPTVAGEYTVNGKITFMLDGEEREQPLNTNTFTVEGIHLSLPSTSTKKTVLVQGKSKAGTKVVVYCNDEQVGATTVPSGGKWSIQCPLQKTYNMASNEFYAKYILPNGNEVKTAKRVTVYDNYAVEPVSVRMSYMGESIFFNYESKTCSPRSYRYFSPDFFYFYIKLNTTDPDKVQSVVLTVFTTAGTEVDLVAKYNSSQKMWVAKRVFDASALPCNISLSITDNNQKMIGKEMFTQPLHYLEELYQKELVEENETDRLLQDMDNAELGSENEQAALQALMNMLDVDPGMGTSVDYSDDEAGMQQWMQNIDKLEAEQANLIKENDMDNPAWNLVAPTPANELGEIRPGLVYTKPSAEVRARYEGIMAYGNKMEEHLDANEYVTRVEDGKPVFVRMTSNGYTLTILDEDLMIVADYSTNASGALRAGDSSRLRQELDKAERKVEGTLNSLLDKVMDLEGSYEEYINITKRDITNCTERSVNAYNNMQSSIKRGWKHVPIGIEYQKKCRQVMRSSISTRNKLLRHLRRLEGFGVLKWVGPIADVYSLVKDAQEFMDMKEKALLLSESIPVICEGDQERADQLREEVESRGLNACIEKGLKIAFDGGSIGASLAGLLSAPVTGPVGPVLGTVGSLAFRVVSTGVFWGFDWYYSDYFTESAKKICDLKCVKDEIFKKLKKDYEQDIFPVDVVPVIDPSGYVYEAVASNRVQDATASIYYKEYVEDGYGETQEVVTLWDAEAFEQKNPMLTDKDGKYGWDVPKGEWQVRIVKDGYLPTYSEWLPVPPPQLDVNLAMSQPTPPVVERVVASENGVQIDFDKYMKPELLTTDQIFLTKSGQKMEGTIRLLNAEKTPDESKTYASRIVFEPKTPLTVGEKVVLTVKSTLESYADVGMLADYTQEFDVQKRVQKIVTDSIYNVASGGTRKISIAAVPVDAAVGKKVTVRTQDGTVVGVSTTELTLDEKGEASFEVSGLVNGSSALELVIADDRDVVKTLIVGVKDKDDMVTLAPQASRISGTEAYYGSTVSLSCETPDAVIWYTLDGTCPCDKKEGSVFRYEGPLTIDGDMTLKAIAIAPDFAESEVATFVYTLRQNRASYELRKGWNWISHNQSATIAATDVVGTGESYVMGDYSQVSELEAGQSYRAYSSATRNVTLTGLAWNASQNSVMLESGWNWIGFPMNQVMTPEEALAFAEAEEGDMLVGQHGFVEYRDGQWTGSLQTLVPGRGYRYWSVGSKSFHLNNTIVSDAYLIDTNPHTYWSSNWWAGSDMMPVTVRVVTADGDTAEGAYEVGAFTEDGQCRGTSSWKDGLALLNVSGSSGDVLHFEAHDKATGKVYEIKETLSFTDNMVGNRNAPTVLTLGNEKVILSGDANQDGLVNVTDIVATVNYIMENPSGTFNFAAADVNKDGLINVTDIVQMVNIIMTSGSRMDQQEVMAILKRCGFIFKGE